MATIARVALSAALFWLGSAHALGPTFGGPTVGLWYNPQESGRGFNIDLQGDTMVVTTFIYQPSGDPIWYLSSGTYDHSTGVFHSTYDSYSDGQCFGAGGSITITFHDDISATLTYPGGSTNIVKFNYGFPSALDNLYGEWALSYDIAGLVGGDWIIFNAPFTSGGVTYASGFMDLSPQDIALGTFDDSLDAFVILVSVGNFEDFYQLQMDDRRGIGAAWVLPSGQTPSGNGSAAAAGRLLYRGELVGTAEAGQAKSAARVDRSLFVQGTGSEAANPAALAAISRLRQAMAEKRAVR
jgi:hypothetical protein